jgi:hypothetical protein
MGCDNLHGQHFLDDTLSSSLAISDGDLGARGGEANDALGWRSFRQETPPCRTYPPASPRSL